MKKSKRPGSNTKSKRDAKTRWNNSLRLDSRDKRKSKKKFTNPFVQFLNKKEDTFSMDVGGDVIRKGSAKSFNVNGENIVVILKSRSTASLFISGNKEEDGKKVSYYYKKYVHPKQLKFYIS